ncbi:hypothetical protein [Streptomyces griseorubiginosus]|uniref:hypothetical protein n=1 Tax=Streptomyces griseorubiginosus TaxID=67304 RepID=UPI0036EE4E7D
MSAKTSTKEVKKVTKQVPQDLGTLVVQQLPRSADLARGIGFAPRVISYGVSAFIRAEGGSPLNRGCIVLGYSMLFLEAAGRYPLLWLTIPAGWVLLGLMVAPVLKQVTQTDTQTPKAATLTKQPADDVGEHPTKNDHEKSAGEKHHVLSLADAVLRLPTFVEYAVAAAYQGKPKRAGVHLADLLTRLKKAPQWAAIHDWDVTRLRKELEADAIPVTKFRIGKDVTLGVRHDGLHKHLGRSPRLPVHQAPGLTPGASRFTTPSEGSPITPDIALIQHPDEAA